MIVVIQCAARKRPDGFWRTDDHRKVEFVGEPTGAPQVAGMIYAQPDDVSNNGESWRQLLWKYNRQPGENPRGLWRAYRLYDNAVYERLANHCGIESLYILSAGWGLIRADFLIPHYNITFSQSSEPYKRRKKLDSYKDFRMLSDDGDDKLLFFGGKDYLPLFSRLTDRFKGTRIIFYNSAQAPQITGCILIRFETPTRTNWHYECAKAFLGGKLQIR
jgi:hypothetical protein